METKKISFVYVLLIIIAAVCLCGFIIQSCENVKSYVRFDGKYYYGGGCTVWETAVGEEIGVVKRHVPKSIFNRNGDSNAFEPGAKLYKPTQEVAYESGDVIYVEFTQIIVHDDQTEEEEIKYAYFEAE